MGGEQHPRLAGQVDAGQALLQLGETGLHPRGERRDEAGVVEVLAHLVDRQHVAEAGRVELAGEVFPVLPARRVRAVGARRDRDQRAMPVVRRLTQRVGEERTPVAVAPVDLQVHPAIPQFRLERSLQRPVLGVDRAHAAEVPVVVRHLFEALVRDAPAARHVAEERDDVVLPLRPAEAREQDGVVGDRLGRVLGARDGRVARVRDTLHDDVAHRSTSATSCASIRRPV